MQRSLPALTLAALTVALCIATTPANAAREERGNLGVVRLPEKRPHERAAVEVEEHELASVLREVREEAVDGRPGLDGRVHER